MKMAYGERRIKKIATDLPFFSKSKQISLVHSNWLFMMLPSDLRQDFGCWVSAVSSSHVIGSLLNITSLLVFLPRENFDVKVL